VELEDNRPGLRVRVILPAEPASLPLQGTAQAGVHEPIAG
jgi:hypothetical protein